MVSNRPKYGAKLTGMDIGEFTIYNAYLSSVLLGLISITVVGGMESYPPPGFLGLRLKFCVFETDDMVLYIMLEINGIG